MKKQQIAAAACLVAGAIGFAAVYSTQKPGKDEIPTEISQTSSIVEPTEKKTPQKTTEKVDSETKMGQEESAAGQQENQQPTEKQLHFVPENVTNWPVKGDVLLPFSMDKTVYFPTLDQYQYNRGMVIRANEGDAVCSVTEGRIIDIYDSAETGCTVVQDLGDGYTATYGQLANLTCSEGDVLEAGETLGIVGESGSGKSTLAKMITRLTDITDGTLKFQGKDITKLKQSQLRDVYGNIQMVFQNPAGSFDPRRTLGDGIGESLRNRGMKKADIAIRVKELLEQCGLEEELAKRYPHEVSGGQCQRAAIARALAVEPKVLICDEATSSLDVTIQKQIMELLEELKDTHGLSFIFICHNLALVQSFCDKVLVLYDGKVVESGKPDAIINEPKEAYTKKLVDAVFE